VKKKIIPGNGGQSGRMAVLRRDRRHADSPPRFLQGKKFGVRIDAAFPFGYTIRMNDWPHSPPHRLTKQGAYMVTCGTYGKNIS